MPRPLRPWVLAFVLSPLSIGADRVISTDAPIGFVRYSADGAAIVGAGADGKIHYWNGAGEALDRETAFTEAIDFIRGLNESGGNRVAISSDGRLAAVNEPDEGVKVLNLETKAGAPLKVAPASSSKLSFSSDGALLAGYDPDRTNTHRDSKIHVWEVATGKERFAASGGLGFVTAITFSPDGKLVLAARADTDIRVWNSKNGELLKTIRNLPVATFSMAFSPDGSKLV